MTDQQGSFGIKNRLFWVGIGIGITLMLQEVTYSLALMPDSSRNKPYLLVMLVLVSLGGVGYYLRKNKRKKINRAELDESETPMKWKNIK